MSLILLMAAFLAPAEVQQGRLIRLTAHPAEDGMKAIFEGKPYPIFVNGGDGLALIPVGVFQKPGPYSIAIQNAKGDKIGTVTVVVKVTLFPSQNIRATNSMISLRPAPGEVERMRALAGMVTGTRYFEDRFVLPVDGCQNSLFGVQRLHNGKRTGNYHRGADQSGAEGTPVRAAASGAVVIATTAFKMNGGTVGLDHGQGLTSHYIHLSSVAVEEGQRVKQGDVIGAIGSTGFATGPHLHWGTVVHGTPVDPAEFVTLTRCAPPAQPKPPAQRNPPPKE